MASASRYDATDGTQSRMQEPLGWNFRSNAIELRSDRSDVEKKARLRVAGPARDLAGAVIYPKSASGRSPDLHHLYRNRLDVAYSVTRGLRALVQAHNPDLGLPFGCGMSGLFGVLLEGSRGRGAGPQVLARRSTSFGTSRRHREQTVADRLPIAGDQTPTAAHRPDD